MQNYHGSGRIFLVKTSSENKAQKDAYSKAFVKRVKMIREGSDVSAAQIARELGLKLDTYYRYESKVVMPHYLIPRFLAVTNGDPRYLLGMRDMKRKIKLTPVS